MDYDKWKLETPVNDSDEVMVICGICGRDHSIHSSNEILVDCDGHFEPEQWCNRCYVEYKKEL